MYPIRKRSFSVLTDIHSVLSPKTLLMHLILNYLFKHMQRFNFTDVMGRNKNQHPSKTGGVYENRWKD